MQNWDYKTFKDNVHGYIKIPKIFARKLIDTEVFQRLRYIEQTSMRILYPSARHDRFIHSYGFFNDEWNKKFSELGLSDVVWVNAKVSMSDLDPGETFILLKDKPIRLKDVSIINTKENKIQLFYLYYNGELMSTESFNKLILFLKEKAKEKAKTII